MDVKSEDLNKIFFDNLIFCFIFSDEETNAIDETKDGLLEPDGHTTTSEKQPPKETS